MIVAVLRLPREHFSSNSCGNIFASTFMSSCGSFARKACQPFCAQSLRVLGDSLPTTMILVGSNPFAVSELLHLCRPYFQRLLACLHPSSHKKYPQFPDRQSARSTVRTALSPFRVDVYIVLPSLVIKETKIYTDAPFVLKQHTYIYIYIDY